MSDLHFTLISDGSSDRALMPLLTRLIEEIRPDITVQGEWADFRNLKYPPAGIGNRIKTALELFPFDLLFIHRDAERQQREVRKVEITDALDELRREGTEISAVCIVPVRMQEAWLLVDENAIRNAAGNPTGRMNLNLPSVQRLEEIPDPKEQLFTALRIASGQSGRKLKKLPLSILRHRVAELIEDLVTLRAVPAFIALENELTAFLDEL